MVIGILKEGSLNLLDLQIKIFGRVEQECMRASNRLYLLLFNDQWKTNFKNKQKYYNKVITIFPMGRSRIYLAALTTVTFGIL